MGYDANVLRRARQQLEDRRLRRADEQAQVREWAYARQPRLEQLDRRLQGTMSQLMAAALRRGEDPGAAIRAIREHGLRVPEDISVIGYDGLGICDYLQPRLTTVAQPTKDMAAGSAKMLLEHIRQGTPARHETIPFSLDCKDSVQGRHI